MGTGKAVSVSVPVGRIDSGAGDEEELGTEADSGVDVSAAVTDTGDGVVLTASVVLALTALEAGKVSVTELDPMTAMVVDSDVLDWIELVS